MTDPILSRLGLKHGQTGGTFEKDNELFLTQFGGEVLTAFNSKNQFIDRHLVRDIQHGKAVDMPVIGTTTARYHKAGDNTHDNQTGIAHSKRTINVDDLLYTNVSIDNLDELKNHYDVRKPYAEQMGAALSQTFDRRIAAVIAKAARSGSIVPGILGGSQIKAGATVANTASKMIESLFAAQAILDEKNVPEEFRYAGITPAMYYAIIQATDAINKDWGGEGSYANGTIRMVGGLELVKTNHLPNTNIAAAVAGENNDYTGDFRDTAALVWQKNAVGTVRLMNLAMQKSGEDYRIQYQADMLLARMSSGSGVLNGSCAVEISKATA